MANIHTRAFITLMIISIITLGKVNHTDTGNSLLTHSYNSSHTKMEGVLSQTLGEELIFNYTDSFSESTSLFSINDLNLTSYNELTINFIIDGDQSSKSGIAVRFDIGPTQVDFLIEKSHQHPTNYSLTQGFEVDIPTVDDFNVTVSFAGQATYGHSGALIIFANSSISNLDVIELTETEQVLEVSPNYLLFEGNMVGMREINTSTAFSNSFNSSYMVDLTISFQANDFQSFNNELVLVLDAEEVCRSAFNENSLNEINFQFEADTGFTFLQLLFQVEVCSDVIEINNVTVTGKMVENILGGEIFHQFVWIDSIDETINLTSFKPVSGYNEQILNISLYTSFEGTTVLNGIDYDIYLGTDKIASGIIGVAKQNGEIQLIEIVTFTDSYQEDLLLKFSADNSGTGTITIFDSSTVTIREIAHIDTDQYIQYFEEETSFTTPVYGALVRDYVDIIFVENTSLPFQLEFLMQFSASDSRFQSIALSLYVDDIAVTTKSISEEGDVHIILDVELGEEFNEIKFVFTILGQGSTLTVENMRYMLKQGVNDSQNPLSPEEEFNIPFFKLPKNIFLGIFVLFDCWLVMGIMLRIYKGRKLRKTQQAENDEFILEIVQLSQE